MATRFPWIENSRLWLVLDRAAARPRTLPEATALCIEGGVDVVVFRMKDRTAAEALPIAREVQAVCKATSTPFVLSHLGELLDSLDVNALHIGKNDQGIMETRRQLDAEVAIGYSAHSVVEAAAARQAGADYVFVGPIFPTASKLPYGDPLGAGVISELQSVYFPSIYIGGMNEQTIPLAVQAGASRVAAISALLSVPDPREAARQLKTLLPPL